MTRRKINRILIIALLLIWSFVGYKFISGYFGKPEAVALDIPVVTNSYEEENARNEFELSKIERDPFLNTYSRTKPKRTGVSTKGVLQRKNDNLSDMPWPSIQYYGFVKGENRESPLALLRISDQLKRVRKGQRIDGLLIEGVQKDSITIVKSGERRNFGRVLEQGN